MLSRVFERHEQAGRPPRWLSQARSRAASFKLQEAEREMERNRMLQLMELERKQAIERARHARAQQARLPLWLLGLGLLGFALVFGAILLLAR